MYCLDINIDYDLENYELLRQALMRGCFESKNIILWLNTKEVI
ncbi:MAG: hypothetical protein E7C86_04580 [Paeniclostridium sordellii]|nr:MULTISPECIES: hypothetical protein [Paeniclostridium]MDU2591877.1 hypothetical protein [Paeniclostridium sordellii]